MSSETNSTVKLSSFNFHGADLRMGSTGQAVGNCILCGKENHLYVNPENTKWSCKKCGEAGNIYTLLRKYWSQRLADTYPADYESLSQLRKGLSPDLFKEAGFARDDDRWLVPHYSKSNSLANLYVCEIGNKFFPTSGLHHHLFNIQKLFNPAHPAFQDLKIPIYITEGLWDCIALEQLLLESNSPGLVLSCPGADVFRQDWAEYFKDRDVICCYDNDSAGQRGRDKVFKLLAPVVTSFRYIAWPSTLPDKYDVNDYFSEHIKTPKKALTSLLKMLTTLDCASAKEATSEDSVDVKEAKITKVEPFIKKSRNRSGKPPTFKKTIELIKETLHLDDNMVDGYAVAFAVILSIQLPGDPLWCFIVGPPGSGKTAMLLASETSDVCYFQSSLTAHSLVSGYKMDDDSDPSLIPKIVGKCLVIKEYTEILALPMGSQEEIYGVLRGAYDGRVDKIFGNGVPRIYSPSYFSLLAGVTQEIYSSNRAALGERFLKFSLIRPGYDPVEQIRRSLSTMVNRYESEQALREAVADFLDRVISPEVDVTLSVPTTPAWVIERLIHLSQVIAYLRASVSRNGRELNYRPHVEIGTRLSKQLLKLGQCIAVVYGKKTVDSHCYRLMEQVAFDTAVGFPSEIIKALIENHPNPMTVDSIAEYCDMSPTTARRRIGDLLEINAIRFRSEKTDPVTPANRKQGRPVKGYVPTDAFMELWRKAKIGQSTPTKQAKPNPLKKRGASAKPKPIPTKKSFRKPKPDKE